jgi:3-dehydroquinate dehydratase / shikimate dehydrogenase
MTSNRAKKHRRMLGVGLGPADTGAALAGYAAVAERADIIELRLDLMGQYDLAALVAERPLPLVVTNRPVREGGRYQGDESARVATLLQALDLGAEYIDLEHDSLPLVPPEYLDRTILSHHDFQRMPADLPAIRDRLAGGGVAIVKVVGMAGHPEHSLPVLKLFADSAIPTIAIAMGPAGLVSRVLALRHDNCFLTYATPATGAEVAPGQLSLHTLLHTYRAREIGPATAAFGVLGDAVEERLLAELNAALRAAGADAVALPLNIKPASAPAFLDFGFVAIWDLAAGATLDKSGSRPINSLDRLVERWANRP